MNSLSWFLYLAEVLPRVNGLAFLLTFLIFCGWFILPPKGVEMFGKGHEYPLLGWSRVKPLIPLWFFLVVLAFLMPSRDTFYLIAGSEAGEAVVTSEAGQEILEDIQEVIQHQLNELKGENKSPDTP